MSLLYCCSKIAHGSEIQKIGCAISHRNHKTQFAHRIGMYVGGTRSAIVIVIITVIIIVIIIVIAVLIVIIVNDSK